MFGGNTGVNSTLGCQRPRRQSHVDVGGRIAVWRLLDTYAGTSSAASGQAADTNRTGKVGTIVWGLQPMPGTIIYVK